MNKREKRFLISAAFGALFLASLGFVYACSSNASFNSKQLESAKIAMGPGEQAVCLARMAEGTASATQGPCNNLY